MLEVAAISALADNYIWLLKSADGKAAVIIDPGEAAPALAALGKAKLAAILITHHHSDHIGGLAEVMRAHPQAPVYAPQAERAKIPAATAYLKGGDEVALFDGDLTMRVLDTPGHTAGHISFAGGGMLFCGDVLFACGCGRTFEGTAAQLRKSLAQYDDLPDATLVYASHEYTIANIGFARAVEPDNAAVVRREVAEKARREKGEPTLPTTLGLERATNPFLRVTEAAVIKAANARAGRELSDGDEVFAALREWKDNFTPQVGG
jgi:hydroxyacylglutathione hydrolase